MTQAFGMEILVFTSKEQSALPEGMKKVTLDELFAQSDVVSLHCPLTPDTKEMVNAARLQTMKPSAILINTGRGPLVNEQDLADALNGGRIAAAGQKMSISKDMDLVYDLKMADKDSTIHSRPDLEEWGRRIYNNMNPEQKKAWDAHYDVVIEKFKAAGLTGKELDAWKYQQYMRDYLRVITSVDRNVGRVLDYLEAEGLMDNTLIVYTSDQGFYMGEHGWFDKRWMYEESFRTPLLVRLPGGVKGHSTAMVQNIDYAPTFLELAGVEVPSDIHGSSFLPVLKGEEWEPNRDGIYYHYYEYPDEHAVKRHLGVRTERYKLIHFYDDGVWELYDLENDRHELNNIYGKPGTEELTAQLKEKLVGLQKKYGEEQFIASEK